MPEGREPKGYTGRVLHVCLTDRTTAVEKPGDGFYRKYLGWSALGTYYCFREGAAGADPLSPQNVLVLATGVCTGAAVSGASRFGVTARSPLTGCIGDSQCGGNWGPELKFAGFDAIVVKGRADAPVYLWLHDGQADIRDASDVWGMLTADTRDALAEQVGDPKAQTVCIGPAGESLVRFACISGGPSDYAGRTGLGAVMGSKHLKAVVCRGTTRPAPADADAVRRLARGAAERMEHTGFQRLLRELGTAGVVQPQCEAGNLATHNFTRGRFSGVDALSGEAFRDRLRHGEHTCYGCVVRCRKTVRAAEPYPVDPAYGGPEFETIALLGSNLEISDPVAVARANQLCNAYGMDTISTGAMIAYFIESCEAGLIANSRLPEPAPRFGDPEAMLHLVEAIGTRQGVGDTLAEGMQASIETFGEATRPFAIHVKNNPFPAHMPQVKPSQALIYAINPFGADHMSSEHDWLAAGMDDTSRSLGLDTESEPDALDVEKVRMAVYSQTFYGLLDTLCLCDFCWGPGALFTMRDLEDFVQAMTGWKVSAWELMKAGERRVNMMRSFNARAGIDAQADTLPARILEPMPDPERERPHHVTPEALAAARDVYYGMMNWDPETGAPTPGKLRELGLSWLLESGG